MGDTSLESSNKADSKKALKKEARKAEKAAKKAEHKGTSTQNDPTNVEEGSKYSSLCLFTYFLSIRKCKITF